MLSYQRRVLSLIALLMIFLLGVVGFLYYRVRWAVAHYQHQLQAAGEKLNIDELIPVAIPPESNGAPIFMQSIGAAPSGTNLLDYHAPIAMQMIAPGKAIVAWAQPEVRSDGTNTWEEIEAALAQYGARLESVRAAAAYPRFDFRLRYHVGPSLLLPHLAPLKQAIQRLTTSELCELHQGDIVAACADIQTMLALVRANADEPLAISQLVRIAMTHIAFTATWELVQCPGVTEQQLATVQREWEEQDFIGPTVDAIAFERAFEEMTLQRMRNSSSQFRQVLSSGGGSGNAGLWFGSTADQALEAIGTQARETRWRLAFSYPDELRMLKGFQVLVEAMRKVRGGQDFKTTMDDQYARLAQLGLNVTNKDSGPLFDPSNMNLRVLFSQSVVGLSRMVNRVLTTEAARRVVVTALALKRYHLRHGQYPAELSALVPEFLKMVPRDPVDGQPLRYKLDGAFLLYSIGVDGVDNKGDASPPEQSDSPGWLKGHDWVWPTPASAEEIDTFWEKRAGKRGR